MNRKTFIESQGATCNNWTWSWSFVNDDERFVIFGAWDIHITEAGDATKILDENWELSRRGRRQPGYTQSLEHIRLVEEEGYGLHTFPMEYTHSDDEDDEAPSKIKGFTPELTPKTLMKVGDAWYASDGLPSVEIPERVWPHETFTEGSVFTLQVNAYERNADARAACLGHYGYACQCCAFDFQAVYGEIGSGYIHVHHLIPLSEIGREYVVDPVADLIPVCPNCHAMIHRTRPMLTIEQVQQTMAENSA